MTKDSVSVWMLVRGLAGSGRGMGLSGTCHAVLHTLYKDPTRIKHQNKHSAHLSFNRSTPK